MSPKECEEGKNKVVIPFGTNPNLDSIITSLLW